MRKCRYCSVPLQGGEICVSCYRARTRKCDRCLDVRGRVLLKHRKGKYDQDGNCHPPLDCERCNNTRWLWLEEIAR